MRQFNKNKRRTFFLKENAAFCFVCDHMNVIRDNISYLYLKQLRDWFYSFFCRITHQKKKNFITNREKKQKTRTPRSELIV